MDDKQVIANIKSLMEEHGLSQSAFAERSGIRFETLNRILHDKQSLTVQMAERIADAFGVSGYDLRETEYSPVNTSVRGYLEFNGEIKRIDNFKQVEAFVKKYKEDVFELPKRVKADAKLEKANAKVAKKHRVEKWDIVLDQIDRYDCSKVDVWAFRKTDDEREDVVLSLGNMCPGYEFDMAGQHFFGSEQAYICGMFSNNDPKHIKIQQELIIETNGYAAKKRVRHKNENLKREDWETFNIEWMKYVVWSKVKGNDKFRDLLLSVPRDAYIVENSTRQKGPTAAIWGAKNPELEDARDRAVKQISMAKNGKVSREEEIKATNALNYIGVYEGKNLMGKILKLCQLALLEGKELDIDYELLMSKNIHLLGHLVDFAYLCDC